MSARHLLNAESQGDRHHRRKPFGYRSDCETDCGRDQFVDGEVVGQFPDHDDDRGEHENGHGQLPTELFESPRQRCIDLLDVRHHRLDAADFGLLPRGGHHAHTGTGRHDRPRVRHGMAVTDACRGVGGDGVLVRRNRLPGQRRLLDTQVRGLEKSHIGGDAIARPDRHDVAGHDGVGLDVDPIPVTADPRVERQHAADTCQRAFGPTLLDESDDRVDHGDSEDHGEVDPFAEDRLEDARTDEDVDQDVVELGGEPEDRRT